MDADRIVDSCGRGFRAGGAARPLEGRVGRRRASDACAQGRVGAGVGGAAPSTGSSVRRAGRRRQAPSFGRGNGAFHIGRRVGQGHGHGAGASLADSLFQLFARAGLCNEILASQEGRRAACEACVRHLSDTGDAWLDLRSHGGELRHAVHAGETMIFVLQRYGVEGGRRRKTWSCAYIRVSMG
eukprot:9480556-Pyramimonas_sp.AAC.1